MPVTPKEENMTKLADLYRGRSGKISDKWKIYLDEYEEKFKSYEDKKINLLEIGIANGGSLEIYGKYFPNAELILGCDIDEKCRDLAYIEPNIKVIVGDATDDGTYKKIAEYPKFDIIIEDGSHTSPDVVRTFCKYFDRLNDGGLFIFEDLHCSYWQGYTGGLFHPLSSINFFKRLIDVINHEHWGVGKKRDWLLKIYALNYGIDLSSLQLESIHSIEFVNSLCFIRKKKAVDNCLGTRIVAGEVAIIDDRALRLGGTISIAPNQTSNQWTNRDLTPDEELISCKRQLKELQEKISSGVNLNSNL